MKFVTAILTSATLLCHATFGCCAHQVHRHSSPPHHCSAAHDRQHVDHSEPSRSAPADDHQCDHVKCQWLKTDSTRNTDQFNDAGCFVTLGQIVADADGLPGHLAASPPYRLGDSTLAPPVRSHLLVSVLLI